MRRAVADVDTKVSVGGTGVALPCYTRRADKDVQSASVSIVSRYACITTVLTLIFRI
jgi:hypothetical protein